MRTPRMILASAFGLALLLGACTLPGGGGVIRAHVGDGDPGNVDVSSAVHLPQFRTEINGNAEGGGQSDFFVTPDAPFDGSFFIECRELSGSGLLVQVGSANPVPCDGTAWTYALPAGNAFVLRVFVGPGGSPGNYSIDTDLLIDP